MKTCAFVLPPNSPLQRAVPERRPKLLCTVFVVLGAHVVLLLGFLIQGCNRTTVGAATAPNADVLFAAAGLPIRAAIEAKTASRPPETRPVGVASGPTIPRSSAFAQAPLPSSSLPAGLALNPPGAAFAQSSGETLMGADSGVGESRGRALVHPAADLRSESPATLEDADLVLYVVRPGDTLARIAKTHRATVRSILAASQLASDRIFPGQKLKIPASEKPKPQSAPESETAGKRA